MKPMVAKYSMLVKSVLVLFVVIVGVGAYFFLYDPVYNGSLVSDGVVKIFAHRGFGDNAPDNSLAGAKLAMENNLDGVDVDGQYSSDDEIVIFHDLSVDRLTTSSGRVNEKTVEQLTALDLGEKYGNGFEGSFVATFEEFVRTITPDGILMVELKVPTSQSTGIEQKAVDIIEKYDAFDKVYLSSFNPLVLYRLKKIDSRVKTVFIFMDTNWNEELLAEIRPEDRVDLPWFLQQEFIRRAIRKIIRPDSLSVNYEVDEAVIDGLIKKGYPVFLWTIDEADRIQWALQKQPFGIISDQPLKARELRDNYAR